MNKKNIIRYFIISCLCAALCAIPAFAASTDAFSLPQSDDFPEVKQLSTDICGWVNSLIEENSDSVPLVTPEQLDFSKAYRVDVDSTMFKQDISTENQLTTALTQSDCYIWELPVSSGDKVYTVTLTIGQPLNPNADLTEEEQQLIQSQTGKWTISSITADGDQPYFTQTTQALTSSADVSYDHAYYVSDATSHCTLAVLSENDALTTAIPLVGMISITDQRTRAASEITFAPDTIYSFDEVKQALSLAEVNTQSNIDGGAALIIRGQPSQSPIVPLSIAAICAAALALICVCRRKTV